MEQSQQQSQQQSPQQDPQQVRQPDPATDVTDAAPRPWYARPLLWSLLLLLALALLAAWLFWQERQAALAAQARLIRKPPQPVSTTPSWRLFCSGCGLCSPKTPAKCSGSCPCSRPPSASPGRPWA